MPKFMAVHTSLKLLPEMVDQLRKEAARKRADQLGVTQLELYYNEDGMVYCLLDAPNQQAVRDHHAGVGVSCGDVHMVESLL